MESKESNENGSGQDHASLHVFMIDIISQQVFSIQSPNNEFLSLVGNIRRYDDNNRIRIAGKLYLSITDRQIFRLSAQAFFYSKSSTTH